MVFTLHRNWFISIKSSDKDADSVLSLVVDALLEHDNAAIRYVISQSEEGDKKTICGLLRLGHKLSLPQGMQQLSIEGVSMVISPCYEVVDALKYLCREGVKRSNFDMSEFMRRQAQADGLFFDLTAPDVEQVMTPVFPRKRSDSGDAPGAPRKYRRT